MPQRTYCRSCNYPTPTCLCTSVSTINCSSQIEIIQHPSETKKAKNTTRIIKLCIPTARIWVGESPNDFEELRMILRDNTCNIRLLYPSDNATTLDQTLSSTPNTNYRLLFIDGTWRKAYKIWQLNPWLAEYPQIKLENISSRYRIRKSPKAGGLSTLECVDQTLNIIEPELNTLPLNICLEKLQSHFPTQ